MFWGDGEGSQYNSVAVDHAHIDTTMVHSCECFEVGIFEAEHKQNTKVH